MRKKHFFLGLVFFGSLTLACNNEPEREAIETGPIEFRKDGELYLLKTTGDTIQKLNIEIADNNYERQTGLMNRQSMETNQGMLFIFPEEGQRSFHMKNTYIPLDLLFFSRDSVAVSFQENAKPEDLSSLPSNAPAQYVLEINGGLVEEWNIETGDKMDFQRFDQ